MNPGEIKEVLRLHQLWLNDSDDGKRANLQEANLQRADLQHANLQRADLQHANLQGAYLRGADLWQADLWHANLRDANLQGADLREADLREANLPHFQIPQGDLIVYKKLRNDVIATLKIESRFERTASLVGRKCRCSGALVLALSNGTAARDKYIGKTKYIVGEYVYPDKYDDDIRVECTHGIHFFLTRQEAEEY